VRSPRSRAVRSSTDCDTMLHLRLFIFCSMHRLRHDAPYPFFCDAMLSTATPVAVEESKSRRRDDNEKRKTHVKTVQSPRKRYYESPKP